MDFSSLLLGTVLIVLLVTGAGLLATMILLERPRRLSPAAAPAAPLPPGRRPGQRQRRGGRRRA